MTQMLLGLNPEAKVISFEPNPKLTPVGDVQRMALSDTNGESTFEIPQGDNDWGRLSSDPDTGSSGTQFSVKTMRMDTLIESGEINWKELPKPILVKIDTEGSEKKVLDGFGDYLSNVSYLLIEVENSKQRGGNYSLVTLSSVLSAQGFSQSKIVYACYDGPDAPAYSDILFWKD